MSIHEYIVNKTTNYVIDNTSKKTDDEVEILKYGIEVIFMNVSKLLIIYILAYMLGYLFETLFVTIAFGLIRSFASGLHVKGFLKCLSFSIAIFTFVIVSGNLIISSYILKIIISIILISGIYIYSPSDTQEKPYFDEENRQKLRKRASLVAIFYSLIWINSIFASYSKYFMPILLIQLILIHPLSYKMLGRRYNNYMYEDEYF